MLNLDQDTFPMRKIILKKKEALVYEMSRYFSHILDALKPLVRKTLRYQVLLAENSKIENPRIRGSIASCNKILTYIDYLRPRLKFYLWNDLEILEALTTAWAYSVRDIAVEFFKSLEMYYKKEINFDDGVFKKDSQECRITVKHLAECAKCAKKLQRISRKLGKSAWDDSYISPGCLDIILFDGRYRYSDEY